MSDQDELRGDALDERARELDIQGRSEMTADEKRDAIAKAEAGGDAVQVRGEAEAAEKAADVETFDVFAEPHGTVLTLNGKAYALNRESLLAVAKLLNAARIETNY